MMEPFYLCNSEIFGLPNSTAVIYNFLCKVNNVSTGKSFYSKESIAHACHVSKSTVVRAFRTLCRKGLLEIHRRFDNGRQTSNDYILLDNPQLRISLEEEQDSQDVEDGTVPMSEEDSTQSSPRLFKSHLDTFKHSLSANAIKVYSYLCFRANKDGQCMPSKKEIAADCEIGLVTVWRAISALRNEGLLEIQPQTRADVYGNNGTSVNLYILKSIEKDENDDSIGQENQPAAAEMQNSPTCFAAAAVIPQGNRMLKKLLCLAASKLSFQCPGQEQIPGGADTQQTPFHLFSWIRGTLPPFTGDTPRTISRRKVLLNPRVKRLFSQLTGWYRRITGKEECRNE